MFTFSGRFVIPEVKTKNNSRALSPRFLPFFFEQNAKEIAHFFDKNCRQPTVCTSPVVIRLNKRLLILVTLRFVPRRNGREEEHFLTLVSFTLPCINANRNIPQNGKCLQLPVDHCRLRKAFDMTVVSSFDSSSRLGLPTKLITLSTSCGRIWLYTISRFVVHSEYFAQFHFTETDTLNTPCELSVGFLLDSII